MRILIDTNKRQILRAFLLPLILLFFLSASAETLHAAAAFSAGATGSGWPDNCSNKPKANNPFAGDGLVSIHSDSCDWAKSCSDGSCSYSGASSAGAYGTDTSLSAVILAALEQISVEPMADAMAEASCAGTSCSTIQCSHAAASAAVTHRVGERPSNPIPPGTPNLAQILNNIHIKAKYRIDATLDGQIGGVQSSFSISGCNINFQASFTSPTYIDTFWEGTVQSGCVLWIAASAAADACVGGATTSTAQVVVDPFLQIDPTWEYAQYFVVEQESLLVPGEWREVTRDWKYFCECDLEPDGDVDGMNLYAFMSDFGRTDCSGGCPGDLDGDGKVDDADLVLFAGDFGKVNCK
jgi:hypothetical protein